MAATICSAIIYSFENGNAFAYYFVFAGIVFLSCITAVTIRKYYIAYTMIKALILVGLLWIPLRVWVL